MKSVTILIYSESWKKVSLEQLPPVNTNLKVNSASHISEKKVAAPTSVDWRRAGKVTDAKQQGSCGSCWAFSSTAAAESYIAINGGSLMDLSEEYVLECTSGSDCTGGYVNRAMSLIVSGGGQPT
jgi:C1A family cysteine protease